MQFGDDVVEMAGGGVIEARPLGQFRESRPGIFLERVQIESIDDDAQSKLSIESQMTGDLAAFMPKEDSGPKTHTKLRR